LANQTPYGTHYHIMIVVLKRRTVPDIYQGKRITSQSSAWI